MTEHTELGSQLVDNLNHNAQREHQETIKEKPKRFRFLFSLKAKHESYFTIVWYLSFGIGFVYGFIKLLDVIFKAIRSGDFATFVIAILLNSIFTMLWGFIGGIVVFVVLVIITFIPYLIVRGFAK